MRTRKEIEDACTLPDVRREILLDIRQLLANLALNEASKLPLFGSIPFPYIKEIEKITREE